MAPRQRRKNLYFLLFSSRDLLRSSLYHRSLLISPYVNCSDSPDSIQILCCYAAVGYRRSCIFKLHTSGAKKVFEVVCKCLCAASPVPCRLTWQTLSGQQKDFHIFHLLSLSLISKRFENPVVISPLPTLQEACNYLSFFSSSFSFSFPFF